MGRELPTGTVTLLFTDIEGSTKLLHELGPEAYAEALADHRQRLRAAFDAHGGTEVDTQGDAFFVAFTDAEEALTAAADAQDRLREGPIRVRMGLHTGRPRLTPEGYVGSDVHKGARIAAGAHGGQVVLSRETRDLVGDGFTISDLGEHRIKDFAEPVWIHQLGIESFPPLKTISNTNLPRPASSFVGREQEVAEVVAFLRDGARLLTLTGPGGSGKTRLSIEAASELVPGFKNGVFWVGLAALRDPELVMETIDQTLGAKDGVAAHIGQREMLLVLDNFEQVVEAAPRLASLIEACPNLRVIVTSREVLQVRGEVRYQVPPLADPEAVELFCSRCGLVPDETIAELCRRLDNLPLAVELAAARTSVLSPAQILGRLGQRLDLLKGGRDAEARQRTLRATIEWSYDLLHDDERSLFARLAVFRGGCDLETAEAVADADLDTLQSLVEKSLLRHTGERFWMLETIREFATERLDASDEAWERRRVHADHFLSLAEEAYPHLKGTPKEWLDRLEAEHDNLRAAMDRFEGWGDLQSALRLGGALYRFWYMRGHLAEGARRLERMLGADQRPTAARADALNGAAVMAANLGDQTGARRRAAEARELHRRLGNHWGAAYAGFLLGVVAAEEGDHETARRLDEESAERFRQLGDDHYALVAMDNLAWSLTELGEIDRARSVLEEEVLPLARASGNERVEAMALGGLAQVALDEQRPSDALPLLQRSLRILLALGNEQMMARDLRRFARGLALMARPEWATMLLAASEALRERSGASEGGYEEMNQRTQARIREQLDEAAFDEAWRQGSKLTGDEAVARALELRL